MASDRFDHFALMHCGDQEFLDTAEPFLREGLEAGEPMLVALTPGKLEALRETLEPDAGELVTFADMTKLGANPARIIPAWQEFYDRHHSRGIGVRGIGEPVWAERPAAQMVECHRHEALLNVAFADATRFKLMCPYDVERLDPADLERAGCTHTEPYGLAFEDPLPPAPDDAVTIAFDAATLREVRRMLEAAAVGAALPHPRRDDLILAGNEIASNSVRHGGGRGILRIWTEPEVLLVDVSDRGVIVDPLVDRRRPRGAQPGGYGLWVANQICDLVQVRSSASGTQIRLHVAR